MRKSEVLSVMNELGYTDLNVVEENYRKYGNGESILWLHDYFLESEMQTLSFPYREYPKEDLIDFINNGDNWKTSSNWHAPDRELQ